MRPLRLSGAVGLFVVGLAVQVGGLHAAQGTASPPQKTSANLPEEFTAIAANISNVGAAGLVPVTIKIERWTGPEEQEKLLNALREGGQDEFLKALTRAKVVGWIATPTSLRYDFFYAQQQPTETGRKVMMITDRPMQIAERLSASPSRDYPFSVIELHLDDTGKGTGTLAQLVQLRLVGNFLGIENLATGPIKLNDLRKVK
jgi:hypothetical protein